MQDNYSIVSRAWLEGTNDFQQRIPNPAQYGLRATANALELPQNADLWNSFSAGLNNTIGYSIIDSLRWSNPYETLRLANLRYGRFIREIMAKWMQTHVFDPMHSTRNDVNPAEFEQWFYSVNYEASIPWSMNRSQLLQAMSGPDGGNDINELYMAAAVAALNTDSLNIYEAINQQIKNADQLWEGGLYRHQVPTYASDENKTARALLKAVRKLSYDMRYPSKQFNHVDAPVFVNTGMGGDQVDGSELFLIVSSENMASITVDAYAELFNWEIAEAKGRILVMPELPIDDGEVILTTDVFVHWHDTVYGIYNDFDPSTLNDNSWLHHQAVLGINPSVPAIVITHETGTLHPVVKMQATGLEVNPEAEAVELGGTVALHPELVGSVTENADGVTIRPDAALWHVSVDSGTLNARTYVDKFGVLHVQKSGIEAGAKITVKGVSVYDDGKTYEGSAEITVTDPGAPEGTYIVTYTVTPDATHGIPEDAVTPSPVAVDAGTDYTLADKPATTEEGWTFTGWKVNGTDATEIKAIAANTTATGAWSKA